MSHEVLHLKERLEGIGAELYADTQLTQLTPSDFASLVDSVRSQPILGEEGALPPITVGERITPETVQAFVAQRWAEIMQSWFSEVLADLLATRLFGPSYFIAFADYSLASGIMEVHRDSHPCSRLRLTIMLDELGAMGYSRGSRGARGVVKQYLSAWRSYIEEAGPQREHELIHHKAEKYTRRAAPRLRSAARAATQQESYLAATFRSDVDDLLLLLRHGLPPAERVDTQLQTAHPATLAAILNAASVFQICGAADLYALTQADTSDDKLKAWAKFDELVLKAIESAEIRREWASAREALSRGPS